MEVQQVTAKTSKVSWKIEKFSSIKERKLYSDIFNVGADKWRLLICSKGNGVDHISISVEVADSATLPSGWTRFARFRLTLVNQFDSKSSTTKDFEHAFKEEESDWGSKSFLPLSELHDPERGYLVNDTCLVEAIISSNKNFDFDSLEITTPPSQPLPLPPTPPRRPPPPPKPNLSSSQSDAVEPDQEPADEEMDTFFTSLEAELASSKVVSLRSSNVVSLREAKEARHKIEQALKLTPTKTYNSGKFSSLQQAFKILSSFASSSTFTNEQKDEFLVMEENFNKLPDRVAKVVEDKNIVAEKESVKLTLSRNLERSVVKFKEAKAELEQVERKIAALHVQLDKAQNSRDTILDGRKQIFKTSKEMKMEMEALQKEWPEYVAKAKSAEEEEKAVEAEWGRMKDFISGIKGDLKGAN